MSSRAGNDAGVRGVDPVHVRVYLAHLSAQRGGKLGAEDLADRIKELKSRQDELNSTRVQVEADMVVRNVELVDLGMVKTYAQDLKLLLQEAEFTERKAFLRSFIKRIEVDEKQVVVYYNLPLPQGKRMKSETEVLPIDTLGGAGGIRTPYLLTASQTFSQLNYSPTNSSRTI